MKKTAIFLLILVILLAGCEKEIAEVVPEVEEIDIEVEKAFCGDGTCDGSENKCNCVEDCGECEGDVEDKTCLEFKCVEEECKEVAKKPCCGNDICESGESDCEDCPSCNDYDICTKDWFNPTELKCHNEPITPCCGNGVCENGESCDNCIDDCDCGIDLSDFPDFFKGDSVLIVIGAKAPSTDVIAGTDIIGSLTDSDASSALDNELVDLDDVNAIVIGTPCDNKISAQLLPYSRDCLESIKQGQSMIKLFKTGKNSYAMLVFGYTPELTRSTASILAKGSDLEETEMILS